MDNGVTPLIGAVFCQHVGAVRALLAHVSCHVDLNRGDKGGANPLIYAAMLNNVEIAQVGRGWMKEGRRRKKEGRKE